MDTKEKNVNYEVKPALVLDMDGTVRRSRSGQKFISDIQDIELFPDVEARLWTFRDMGWLILGATNQGGVAYGHRTEKDVEDEMKWTRGLFDADPFHHVLQALSAGGNSRVEPYCHESMLRKPHIGMLALFEVYFFERGLIIDWPNSLVVGDRMEDYWLARNARVSFQWEFEFFKRPTPELTPLQEYEQQKGQRNETRPLPE